MSGALTLRLTDIRKSYGGRTVLDVPRFTFSQGQRYALIGANGSGKSTLLRIVAGLLKPDTGSVDCPPVLREKMGFMPQQPYAYGFSVLRNVTIALPDTPQPQARQLALAALRQVELEHLAQASGNKLSGGETQRMALARMIARQRPLLLLDEPTSATDIAGHDCIERALLEYCAESGCTLIFATHSLAQAQRLAQQVVMLDAGRIVEAGAVGEVLRNPQSREGQLFLRHWRLD